MCCGAPFIHLIFTQKNKSEVPVPHFPSYMGEISWVVIWYILGLLNFSTYCRRSPSCCANLDVWHCQTVIIHYYGTSRSNMYMLSLSKVAHPLQMELMPYNVTNINKRRSFGSCRASSMPICTLGILKMLLILRRYQHEIGVCVRIQSWVGNTRLCKLCTAKQFGVVVPWNVYYIVLLWCICKDEVVSRRWSSLYGSCNDWNVLQLERRLLVVSAWFRVTWEAFLASINTREARQVSG